jgi:hypothetical protein
LYGPTLFTHSITVSPTAYCSKPFPKRNSNYEKKTVTMHCLLNSEENADPNRLTFSCSQTLSKNPHAILKRKKAAVSS